MKFFFLGGNWKKGSVVRIRGSFGFEWDPGFEFGFWIKIIVVVRCGGIFFLRGLFLGAEVVTLLVKCVYYGSVKLYVA